MRNQLMFTAPLKAIFVTACMTIGFTGFTAVYAQSIVGKWNGVSVKNYFSDEYAKEVGKPMIEKSAKETGASTIEYKADHTFVVTFSAVNDPKVTTMKGTWELNGDQLKATFEPAYNPRKTTTTATVSFTGNTMITTVIMAPPSRIAKSISTSVKM